MKKTSKLTEVFGYIYDRPSTNLWFHEFAFMTQNNVYLVVDLDADTYNRLKHILWQGNYLKLKGYLYPDESLFLVDAEMSLPVTS